MGFNSGFKGLIILLSKDMYFSVATCSYCHTKVDSLAIFSNNKYLDNILSPINTAGCCKRPVFVQDGGSTYMNPRTLQRQLKQGISHHLAA